MLILKKLSLKKSGNFEALYIGDVYLGIILPDILNPGAYKFKWSLFTGPDIQAATKEDCINRVQDQTRYLLNRLLE